MKALQVKRNSLRSLWRRGLVIFSILALVFAFGACRRPVDPPNGGPNGNGNGPPPPPPARHVVEMNVLRGSQVMNFEGQVADLTGLRVSLTWSDGTVSFSENPADFYTIPYILCRETVPNQASPTQTGIQFHDDATYTSGTQSFFDVGSVVWLVHRTNPMLTRAFPLPFVRGFANGGAGVTDPAGNIDVTGRLARQDRFEDDLIDFVGVTVEGIYTIVDLSQLVVEAVSADILPTSLQAFPPALVDPHLNARVPIVLSHAHLDTTTAARPPTHPLGSSNVGGVETAPVGYPTDANTEGRGIRLQLSTVQVHLPITNWFPISHVLVESINNAGFPDIFQFWLGDLNWPDILFNQANLRLRVHYNGTLETRVIGLEQFRRAEALGKAQIHAPNLSVADVDEMIAQVRYFGVIPAGAHPPWQPDLHPWVNRTVDVQIPVLEFDGSIMFQRRPTEVNVPNIIWPHIDTFAWMPQPDLIEAIWRTYDLVAVYAGGRTLSINYIIGRQMPGGLFSAVFIPHNVTGPHPIAPNPQGWHAPEPDRVTIWTPVRIAGSASPGEIEEAELNISFPPSSMPPGHTRAGFWNALMDIRGNNLDWTATAARIAFGGLTADEEIQLQVLPRPPLWRPYPTAHWPPTGLSP